MGNSGLFDDPEQLTQALKQSGYLCHNSISLTVFLGLKLAKPILVEGPPGVGKTMLASCMAQAMNTTLIRLQCFEGLDETKAIYEWKYAKQLLYTQVLKDHLNEIISSHTSLENALEHLKSLDDLFFSAMFLEPRALLKAIQSEPASVLLIDEIDKSDEEFEALLLEFLADYQVTLPEIGTIKARSNPLVILTSNNTRELSDAFKRRCLYLYIDFPDALMEQQIVTQHLPNIHHKLCEQIVKFVQKIRNLDIKKTPAISETIDWAKSLLLLNQQSLEPSLVSDTLNLLLKHQDDLEHIKERLAELLKE